MQGSYKWKTAAVIRETKEVVTIIFNTGTDIFQYKPGQFINVTLNIDNTRLTRSYSLSSVADEDEKPAITVKKVNGGVLSGFLISHAEEIEEWEIDGPHGFFFPGENESYKRQIVLIAAGSGITPIFSLLKFFLKHSAANVLLVNANRQTDDIIFRKVLEYLENSFSHRFKVWHALSGNEAKGNHLIKNIIRNRLNKLLLKKVLKTSLGELMNDAIYYLCGPPGYMRMVADTLASINIPEQQIHCEYFTAPEDHNPVDALPQEMLEVLFHYYHQVNLLEVQPGKTILEAALEDHIPVNYSCKNGTCGTCAAQLVSGRVHMTRNFSLPEAMIENGIILLCQSHPLTDNVTVMIDNNL